MGGFQTIAKVGDVPEGRGLTVQLGDRRLAIFKAGPGWEVLDARCPHRGGPLGEGWVENGKVYCPLHGWDFELATGRCGENPEKSVEHFPARVVNGEIQIYIT